jgi:hypothetical protein
MSLSISVVSSNKQKWLPSPVTFIRIFRYMVDATHAGAQTILVMGESSLTSENIDIVLHTPLIFVLVMHRRSRYYRQSYHGVTVGAGPSGVLPSQDDQYVEQAISPKLQHWAKLPITLYVWDFGQEISCPIKDAYISFHRPVQEYVTYTRRSCRNTIPGIPHHWLVHQ